MTDGAAADEAGSSQQRGFVWRVTALIGIVIVVIIGVTQPRKRSFRSSKFVVTLSSRNNQTVEVGNESDRQFLELADKFVLAAEKVERDPARKVPRLSLP